MADRTTDVRDTSLNDTPKVISNATWITVAALLVIVILGVLMMGGFFGSTPGGRDQPSTGSSSTSTH